MCNKDVTNEYLNMINSFEADFSLATTYNELDYVDFKDLIANKNERFLKDIELLSKLSFNLRYGIYKIIKVGDDSV